MTNRIGALCLALLSAACSHRPASGAQRELTLATWNLEWLMSATSLATLRQRCLAPSHERALPCDVPESQDRNSGDLDRLARYARQLDADVIAVQEVEGVAVARQVFPGYAFCFSARRDLQNVGFAIRPGLPFRCGPDLQALSLRDRVRRGAELVLLPGTRQELHLLSIHLKSGCARQPLDSPATACAVLARQVPFLEEWIDTQARAGARFAVMGDFNRDLRHELPGTGGIREQLDDGDPANLRLRDVSEGTVFSNCVIGQTFTGFIDYILLGGTLADTVVQGSFRHEGYAAADARHYHLSDHCPVVVRLRLGGGAGTAPRS